MTATLAPVVIEPQQNPEKRKAGGMNRKKMSDWLVLLAAIVVGILIAIPFVMILINSFKSPADYNTSGPLALPRELYFDGIVAFWERVNFPEKLWNSIYISGLVAIFATLVSVLNAFAIGIGRIRGRTTIIVLFLLANMLPQEALLYPLYYMFKEVGLYNSQWAIIIIFTVIQSAFGSRWREPLANPVAGRGSDQPPDALGSRHLLLYLDLE